MIPFAWCFYRKKNFNIRYSWFDQTIFTWCDETWRWNGRRKCSCLAHLCFHLQDVVKSSCSVPLEELQFDLHVFQWKITNFERKRKRSLAHASTDHAKTIKRKPRKILLKKAGIKYRNSGKSKKCSGSTNTFWS